MKWLHFDVIKIYTRTTLTRERESRASSVCRQTDAEEASSTCRIMIPPTSCEYKRCECLSRLAWSFYAALNFNQRHEKKCASFLLYIFLQFLSLFFSFAIWRAMNPFAMHTQRINNLILHFNERKIFMTRQMYRKC